MHLTLIRRPWNAQLDITFNQLNLTLKNTAAMPEEQPLQALIPLQLILEAKFILLVREFQQVQQFRARLHDRKRRVLRVVHDDGDPTVWVQAEEPFLLLLVRADVDDGKGEFGAVRFGQLFQEDLHFLPIGCGLRDEVQAFCLLDVGGSVGDVEVFGHDGLPGFRTFGIEEKLSGCS